MDANESARDDATTPLRLLLVELLSTDPFSQYRSELFPFFHGYVRHRLRGAESRWVCFGQDPSRHASQAFVIELAAEDRTRLTDLVRAVGPTHILLNERPGDALAAALKEGAPGAVVLSLDDQRAAVNLRSEAGFRQWLGVRPAGTGSLVDAAQPDYDCERGNALAEGIEALVSVVAGPACLYARPLAQSPDFADVPLGPGVRSVGCSFCGAEGELSYPYETPPVPLALGQIRAAAEGAPPFRRAGGFSLDGAALFFAAPDLMEAVLEAEVPPSAFWLTCRLDELRRVGPKLEPLLPRIRAAGHLIHIHNMGIENFSPRENERFNKGIDESDLEEVLALLTRWDGAWPGTVVFQRYGGFGFILATPWTTLDDLASNADAIRRHALEPADFYLTTRLLLLPGRPLTALAERDGLLAPAFEDPLMEEVRLGGCLTSWDERELPWRFARRSAGLVHRAMIRLSTHAPADHPEVRRARELVAVMPAPQQRPLPVFEALVAAARTVGDDATPLGLLETVCREAYEAAPLYARPEYRRWLRGRLTRIASHLSQHSGRLLGGYTCGAPLETEDGSFTLRFSKGDDEFELSIHPRAEVPRPFVATRQLAIVHPPETNPDTAERRPVVDVLLRFLERHTHVEDRERP